MFPEKFQNINIDYPRLVIPFFDKSGKMFAYQGRAFGNEQPRYITLKLEDNKEKIYGLERIDFEDHVYVVEGPLDSLFLDNCLAVAGADLDLINSELVQLRQYTITNQGIAIRLIGCLNLLIRDIML